MLFSEAFSSLPPLDWQQLSALWNHSFVVQFCHPTDSSTGLPVIRFCAWPQLAIVRTSSSVASVRRLCVHLSVIAQHISWQLVRIRFTNVRIKLPALLLDDPSGASSSSVSRRLIDQQSIRSIVRRRRC